MSEELKKYIVDMPLILRESTAARLGVENRLYQVGENIYLPDDIAKKLLAKDGLTLILPREQVAELVKSKRRKTVKTNEVKDDGTISDNN